MSLRRSFTCGGTLAATQLNLSGGIDCGDTIAITAEDPPPDQTLHASFYTGSLTLDQTAGADPQPIGMNGAVVFVSTTRLLRMSGGGSGAFVAYNATGVDAGNTGCLRITYAPEEDAPVAPGITAFVAWLGVAPLAIGSPNTARIYEDASGLHAVVSDWSGAAMWPLDVSPWSRAANSVHELELDWDFGAGVCSLFVDGVLAAREMGIVGTRGSGDAIEVGHDDISGAAFGVRDLLLFAVPQHPGVSSYVVTAQKRPGTVVVDGTLTLDATEDVRIPGRLSMGRNGTDAEPDSEIRVGCQGWYGRVRGTADTLNMSNNWDPAADAADDVSYSTSSIALTPDEAAVMISRAAGARPYPVVSATSDGVVHVFNRGDESITTDISTDSLGIMHVESPMTVNGPVHSRNSVASAAPHGFDDVTATTLSYDPGTGGITLTKVGVDWGVWFGGELVTYIADLTLSHPAAYGVLYYFWLEVDGLHVGTTPPGFVSDRVHVATVAAVSATWGICEETRHPAVMDVATRGVLHTQMGMYIETGGDLGDYALQPGAGTLLGNQWSFTSALVHDEDTTITTDEVPGKGTNNYTCVALSGAAGDLAHDSLGAPYWYDGITQMIKYNCFVGGVWDLLDLADGQYVNYWLFLTTSIAGETQVLVLPGQQVYTDSATAELEIPNSLTFPSPWPSEYLPVWRITYLASSALAYDGKCVMWTVQRFYGNRVSIMLERTSGGGGGGGTGTHNSLSGLQEAGAGVTWGHVTSAAQSLYGVKTFANTTQSIGSNSGAVVVSGGLGVGMDTHMMGKLWMVDSRTTGSNTILFGISTTADIYGRVTGKATSMSISNNWDPIGFANDSDTLNSSLLQVNVDSFYFSFNRTVGGVPYRVFEVNKQSLKLYNAADMTKYVTVSVNTDGDVLADCSGHDWIFHNTDSVMLYNPTEATSSILATLVCSGGMGVVKKLYAVGGVWTTDSRLNASGIVHFGVTSAQNQYGRICGTEGYLNLTNNWNPNTPAADYGSAYTSALTLAPTEVALMVSRSAGTAPYRLLSVANDGYIRMYNASNEAQLTTFQVDSNGDMVVDCGGNDWSWASTNSVHVLNSTEAVSSSSAPLVVSGGMGVAKKLYVAGGIWMTDSRLNTNGIVHFGVSSAANQYGRICGTDTDLNITNNWNPITSGYDNASAYCSAIVVDPGTIELKVSDTVASVPHVLLSVDYSGTVRFHCKTAQSSQALWSVDAGGDLTLECNGHDFYIDTTDIVHITNTTNATSSTSAPLLVSGGMGVAKKIYAVGGIWMTDGGVNSNSVLAFGTSNTVAVYGRVYGQDGYLNLSNNWNVSAADNNTYNSSKIAIAIDSVAFYMTAAPAQQPAKVFQVSRGWITLYYLNDSAKSANMSVDVNGDARMDCSGNDWIYENTDSVRLLNTTEATNSTTATLICSGGVGIAKKLYAVGGVWTTDSRLNASGIMHFGVNSTQNQYGRICGTEGYLNITNNWNPNTPAADYAGDYCSAVSLAPDTVALSVSQAVNSIPKKLISVDKDGYLRFHNRADDTKQAVWSVGPTGNLYLDCGGNDFHIMGTFTMYLDNFPSRDATSSAEAPLVISGGVGISKRMYAVGGIFCTDTPDTFEILPLTSISAGADNDTWARWSNGGMTSILSVNWHPGTNMIDNLALYSAAIQVDANFVALRVAPTAGEVPYNVFVVSNDGSAKLYNIADFNQYISMSVDSVGDIAVDCRGGEWSWASNDTVRIANSTEASSSTVAPFTCAGGAGVTKKLYAVGGIWTTDTRLNASGVVHFGVDSTQNQYGRICGTEGYLNITNNWNPNTPAADYGSAYTSALTLAPTEVALMVSRSAGTAPYRLLSVANDGYIRMYNKDSEAKLVTFQVDGNGDMTADCGGNNWNWASTDTVHVLNSTEAVSSTSAPLLVSGGVGIAKKLYAMGGLYFSDTAVMASPKTGVIGGCGNSMWARMGSGPSQAFLSVNWDPAVPTYDSATNTSSMIDMSTTAILFKVAGSFTSEPAPIAGCNADGTFRIFNPSTPAMYASMWTSGGGDLAIDCNGNDLYFHNTDRVHVDGTEDASGTTGSGAFQCLGGAGFNKGMWVNSYIRMGNLNSDLLRPIVFGHTNKFARIWTESHALYMQSNYYNGGWDTASDYAAGVLVTQSAAYLRTSSAAGSAPTNVFGAENGGLIKVMNQGDVNKYLSILVDTNGIPTFNATGNVLNFDVTDRVQVQATTETSTSTSTALSVAGGIYAAKNMVVGGPIATGAVFTGTTGQTHLSNNTFYCSYSTLLTANHSFAGYTYPNFVSNAAISGGRLTINNSAGSVRYTLNSTVDGNSQITVRMLWVFTANLTDGTNPSIFQLGSAGTANSVKAYLNVSGTVTAPNVVLSVYNSTGENIFLGTFGAWNYTLNTVYEIEFNINTTGDTTGYYTFFIDGTRLGPALTGTTGGRYSSQLLSVGTYDYAASVQIAKFMIFNSVQHTHTLASYTPTLASYTYENPMGLVCTNKAAFSESTWVVPNNNNWYETRIQPTANALGLTLNWNRTASLVDNTNIRAVQLELESNGVNTAIKFMFSKGILSTELPPVLVADINWQGYLTLYYYQDATKYTQIWTDGSGNLNVNANGNQFNFHNTDQVRILNTTDTTGVGTGGLVALGGASVTKALVVGASVTAPTAVLGTVGATTVYANSTWYASFYSVIAANYSYNGILAPTTTYNISISSNQLQCNGQAYATFPLTAETPLGNQFTIRFLYTPKFTYTSTNPIVFSSNPGGSANHIRVYHNGASGSLILIAYDSLGNIVLNSGSAWSYTLNQQYEMEIDIDLTNNASRMYINGVQFGAVMTNMTANPRTYPTTFTIGSTTDPLYASISRFLLFNAVMHNTASYTPTLATDTPSESPFSLQSNAKSLVRDVVSVSTTASTSTTTGAIVSSGGIGAAGMIYSGNHLGFIYYSKGAEHTINSSAGAVYQELMLSSTGDRGSQTFGAGYWPSYSIVVQSIKALMWTDGNTGNTDTQIKTDLVVDGTTTYVLYQTTHTANAANLGGSVTEIYLEYKNIPVVAGSTFDVEVTGYIRFATTAFVCWQRNIHSLATNGGAHFAVGTSTYSLKPYFLWSTLRANNYMWVKNATSSIQSLW